MEILLEHLAQGLWLSLLLSMPAVLLAASVGLVVGILQAVTQVQEQTIAAAPKILSVFMLIIFGGPLMLNMLTDYIREAIFVAFNEVPQSEVYILPPKPKTAGQLRAANFFKDKNNYTSPEKVKAFFNTPGSALGSGGEGSGSSSSRVRTTTRPAPGFGENLYLKQEKR